jgi:hypothetical protein
MDAGLFKTLGQIAGIGGIALGVVLIVFREVIRAKILPMLDARDAYRLIRLIVVLVFILGVTGIGFWAANQGRATNPTLAPESSPVAAITKPSSPIAAKPKPEQPRGPCVISLDAFTHITAGNGDYHGSAPFSSSCKGFASNAQVQAIIDGYFRIDGGGNWASLFATVNDGTVKSTEHCAGTKNIRNECVANPHNPDPVDAFHLTLPVPGVAGKDGDVIVRLYVERAETSTGGNLSLSAVPGRAHITVTPL